MTTSSTLTSVNTGTTPVSPEVGDTVYLAPPTFSQQRLWLMQQMRLASPVYTIQAAYRIKGKLNCGALDAAMNEIVRRHEVLRTTFAVVDGELKQIIAPEMRLRLMMLERLGLPETEREKETTKFINAEICHPFNVNDGPLIRAGLLKLGAEEHVFVVNLHHLVSDGWSCSILGRELEALYAAFAAGKPSPLPPLAVQFADYAIWERQWIQGERLKTQLAYWKERLRGAPPVLELPADRTRPAQQTFHGALMPFEFSPTLSRELKELSRREQVSPFMTLLAAYKVLLHRYTGQTDLLVGSPVANRPFEELERMIGFFVNVLIFRTDVSGDPTFRSFMHQVRDVTTASYEHKEAPFENLVEELRPERDLSHNPLFQVLFAFHAAPLEIALKGLECELIRVDNGVSKFDLYFELWEIKDHIAGRAEYSTELFDHARIARMIGHYQSLLQGIVSNPEQRLSQLPLLTEPERHQILVEWNDTRQTFPQDQCIHELFEAQVEQSPQATALICGQQRLSYAELNQQADDLAKRLRALGLAPETRVGICLDRSPVLVAAILATLKAGGTYVPMDPDYPPDRLQFMLQDAQAPVLITEQKYAGQFPATGMSVLCLDKQSGVERQTSQPASAAGTKKNAAASNSPIRPKPDQLAYVLYTSGSTGRPKGVAIEHRRVVNLISWASKAYTAEERTGVFAATSVCFDLSVFEFFVPLCSGGKLILAENVLQLPEIPAANEVTLVNTVPSAIAELLREKSIPASVRVVNLAGEPLSAQLVDQVYQANPHIQKVYDLYGPTEDTVYSTMALRRPGAPATIGRPLANKQIYLLDTHFQPVPVGVPGELFIGGAGVARGYLHQPELTAEKFLADPFSSDPAARLYRTGDVARYLPDGNIEFLGRKDHQVKLRGYRIELGEIEAVLAQHPAVKEVVITIQGKTVESKQLAAHLVLHAGQTTTENELRALAKAQLPDYMVPAIFLTLDALPLTPNGKIDRQTLAAMESRRLASGREIAAPRTAVEKRLGEIWSAILDVKEVGIHDNFFDLGGHSLLAIQVSSRIQTAFNIKLTMLTLFELPTIAQLANALEEEIIKEINTLSEEEARVLAEDV